MREEFVTVQGEYELAGTVTAPGNHGKYPAVLIIPGTGESDRDGNRGGLDMNVYRELAEFLTEIGFVTLRFDKRGTFESKGNKDERGMWDMVDDGVACLRFLKRHPLVGESKVLLLGHSEGTLLGPAMYVKEPVAGMILISGGAMCLRDIMVWQRKQAYRALENAGGLKGWLIRTLNVIEKAEKKTVKFEEKILGSDTAFIRVMGKKFPAKWMREHYHYNVAADMERVQCPVLLLTGGKDIQVPVEAVQKAAELAGGEVETHVIANMTHILKELNGEMDAANPLKVYKQQANEPLHPELLYHLERWMTSKFLVEAAPEEMKS